MKTFAFGLCILLLAAAHAEPIRTESGLVDGVVLESQVRAWLGIPMAAPPVRELRWKQPRQYLDQLHAGSPLQEQFEVSSRDLSFEFMLNALRLTEGVPTALFAERTGMPLSIAAASIAEATRKGLLEPDPLVLRPTALGRRFLNDLQQLFLPDRAIP